MKLDKVILSMAVGQVFTWAGLYYVFPALLLRWEQDLGWSRSELTTAITLAVLVSALTAWPAGRLIDQGRGPQLMAGGTLLGCAALFACSFVQHYWQFVVLWGLIGVSLAGCLYEPCFAVVTRARGRQAKRAIIFITLVAGFAGAVSFTSTHLLAEAFGWRMTLRIEALAVAVLGSPILWVSAHRLEAQAVKAHRPEVAVENDPRQWGWIGHPVFWLLGVGFALLAIVHGVTLHHLLPMLHERRVPAETAVLMASLIGPMQVVGRLGMVAVERYVAHHHIAIATFVLMGLSILVLLEAGDLPARLLGFVLLFGGSYGMVSIIRPVITRDLLGQTAFGTKSGGLALLYLCGSASAPFVGSLLWEIGGYRLVLHLLTGLAGIGLVLYVAADRIVAHTNAEGADPQ